MDFCHLQYGMVVVATANVSDNEFARLVDFFM
jgi:hypothetical protein